MITVHTTTLCVLLIIWFIGLRERTLDSFTSVTQILQICSNQPTEISPPPFSQFCHCRFFSNLLAEIPPPQFSQFYYCRFFLKPACRTTPHFLNSATADFSHICQQKYPPFGVKGIVGNSIIVICKTPWAQHIWF